MGLFLDMGLGKTAITLSIIEKIKGFESGTKVLIIAPKRVAETTWTDEISKWSNFKDLKASLVIGTPKKRLEALNNPADIYIVNRDNIKWLIENSKWDYTMLVIDELTSFKSPSSQRFKALKKEAIKTPRVIGLTGTPVGNDYMDLWSQIFLLDGGASLGKYITHYRNNYLNGFFCGAYTEWVIKDGAEEQIKEQIAPFCISMKAEDYLELKEPIIQDDLLEYLNDERRKI